MLKEKKENGKERENIQVMQKRNERQSFTYVLSILEYSISNRKKTSSSLAQTLPNDASLIGNPVGGACS